MPSRPWRVVPSALSELDRSARKSLMTRTAATVTLGSERRWHGRLRLRYSFKPVPARAGSGQVRFSELDRRAPSQVLSLRQMPSTKFKLNKVLHLRVPFGIDFLPLQW